MAASLDMLSLLPDPLLIKIISLLPFKEAVRTSLLSKSWYNNKLFKLITSVELNELFFVKSQDMSIRELERKAFLDFITFWTDNSEKPIIEKFSFKLSLPKDVRELTEKCIAFATHRGGVKELDLHFWDPYNVSSMFELPENVYELRGIQTLKLHSCTFDLEKLKNFHALKEVSFAYMKVSIFDINYLLSNCKMIENLSLKRLSDDDDCEFSIRDDDDDCEFSIRDENQKLKKLVVKYCAFKSHKLRLVAPNLKWNN